MKDNVLITGTSSGERDIDMGWSGRRRADDAAGPLHRAGTGKIQRRWDGCLRDGVGVGHWIQCLSSSIV